jgi:16S rRNA (guanine527-N7)-methyltransferase
MRCTVNEGELRDVRRESVEAVAGAVSDESWQRLGAYVKLLREDARRLSLISRRAEGEIGYHVLDSAALLRAVREESGRDVGRELVDLGTGAGLPGIVIAILRPGTRAVLVDSRNSRVVFLKRVVRELGLSNVEIEHARLETLHGGRRFELAVSRAIGSLQQTLAPSLRLLDAGGRLILFKGPSWDRESGEAARIAAAEGCVMGWVRKVALPGLERQTWFVEFHVEQPLA